jgi:hypothetical protein
VPAELSGRRQTRVTGTFGGTPFTSGTKLVSRILIALQLATPVKADPLPYQIKLI